MEEQILDCVSFKLKEDEWNMEGISGKPRQATLQERQEIVYPHDKITLGQPSYGWKFEESIPGLSSNIKASGMNPHTYSADTPHGFSRDYLMKCIQDSDTIHRGRDTSHVHFQALERAPFGDWQAIWGSKPKVVRSK